MKKEKPTCDDLFLKTIRPLRTKYHYVVKADKPIISKEERVDYLENDLIIEKFKEAMSISEREECILKLLSNFDNYFNKYIRLLKHDYRSALSKDTLQFIGLFARSGVKDMNMEHIGKICSMFKGILNNYDDGDLHSEFVIIAIDLMQRYRKRQMVSFTQYFIKLFRYRVANFIRGISPDLGNSLAFSDNTINMPHLEKRLQAHHEFFATSDLTNDVYVPDMDPTTAIDAMWIMFGDVRTEDLTAHERFMLYRKYIQRIPILDLAKEQHTSSIRLNKIFGEIISRIKNQ